MASTPKGSLKRRVSLYKAFSGLRVRHRGSPQNDGDEAILVCAEEREEGGEQDLVFFKKLDNEFNKVNGFYKKKVNEVMEEADDLSKQMNALITFRAKVDKVVGFRSSATNDSFASRTSASMDHHINDAKPRRSSLQMDVIQEIEMSHENHLKDESGSCVNQPNSTTSLQGFRPAPLEILDHVKINVITPETPVATLKGLLLAPNHDLSFSNKELRKTEERMSIVFKEFYHKLQLLKRYR
ncbi:Phosphate transporter PHO1-like 2 [Spatholobus suberectus]|nr:Phosphate transporter PHO1-like 2 [Spatholobus suberectus]